MRTSQVAIAAAEYAKGNYAEALKIYERLGQMMGESLFRANIQLCIHRLAKIEGPATVVDSAQVRQTFCDQSITKKPSELFQQILNDLKYKTTYKHKFEKNKIAYFLHNSLPYSSGGYATRGHGLALALSLNGYNIVCCTRPGFPIDIEGDHTGKELSEHDKIDKLDYWRIFGPLRKGVPVHCYVNQSANEIKSFLLTHKIQIAIAASNHITALPVCIAARQLGIPFIYEVRGFWEITRLSREPEIAKNRWLKEQIYNETQTAKHADAVFTLTQPMREELIKRGINNTKITLLPNSCDPSRFTPRPRDLKLAQELSIPENVPVIGYIGSFVQYEGLENLAQACAMLLDRGIDFRLLIVGNENASGSTRGPITEEIHRVANACGLGDKLIMPGRVPHEQVESFYSLIDIAPFPRKPQPVTEMVSPMKPLEALAMEKAVVVSSVRALQEMIIDNETGLIFEKGNIENLTSKLEVLIKNKNLRDRLGKNGRKWVEKERTWNKTASVAADVIKGLLENETSIL
jgi:glycosyltransferase involved in cell wall biosynthesis